MENKETEASKNCQTTIKGVTCTEGKPNSKKKEGERKKKRKM